MTTRVDENFLALGKLLAQLQEEAPDDFRKLIKNTGLGQRKAYYLIDIHKAFRDLDVDEARLKAIGWTKASALAPHVTAANLAEMLRVAEENNARDLQLIVKGELPDTDRHCVLMYFDPEDYKLFARVIVAHGGTQVGRQLYDKEDALMRVLRRVAAESAAESREGPDGSEEEPPGPGTPRSLLEPSGLPARQGSARSPRA